MPHEGHFLESDVPMAAYLYNSPLRGNLRYLLSSAVSDDPPSSLFATWCA